MSDAFTGRPEFNREEAQPWARERKVVFTEQPTSVDVASDETDDSRASFSIETARHSVSCRIVRLPLRVAGSVYRETRRVSQPNVQVRVR